jgi:hypothetical protein
MFRPHDVDESRSKAAIPTGGMVDKNVSSTTKV